MKKALLVVTVVLIASGLAALPALALKPPVIKLERVEVASIQPFYVKPKIAEPSKENPKKKVDKVKTYGYSSTLNTAYIFDITNPNKKPIMLDELSFTVTFDGFDVNTVTAYEDSWIPGGKHNHLRVIATNEAFPTIISLMVGAMNVKRVKEMKTSAGALVSKWWKNISDFSFPIGITNGNAVFKDEKGKMIRVNFSGKFGKAAAAPAKKPKGSGSK
ncbi:MAG: hypothetical protein P8182_13665 [Deltaproteobacteria bacterium]